MGSRCDRMKLPKYRKYKDSRHDGIGWIPSEWTVKPLWAVATINPSRAARVQARDEGDVSFVPMDAVTVDGKLHALIRPFEEVERGYTPFRDGDVLLAKITPCFENGKRALARNLLNGIGFGSTEFHVLRSTGAVDA